MQETPASEGGEPVEGEEDLTTVEVAPGEAPASAPPPASELDPRERRRIVLSLLFASPDPLPTTRLAEAAGLTLGHLRETVAEIREWLRREPLPFQVEEVGGGFRLLSAPEMEPYIRRLERVRRPDRLSQAALETLALIAYRQPLIKAEIEAIRGVQVGPMLRTLIEKRLVKVLGRAKVPGRPLQYGTTPSFLDRFGLRALEELPTLEELRQS